MDLHHDAVGTGGGGRVGHGGDQIGLAGGMAGIDHHGQVGQIVQNGDCGKVEGVPGGGLKGADAPLAEDDLAVALAHDIFGAHEQLLQGVGKSPFQQNGLVGLAQLFQKVKVLHIPRTYLNDIHIGEQIEGGNVHDLRDDGQPRGLFGLQKQPDALVLHALKGVGGGAGLERAAPENGCAGFLDGGSDGNDLLLGFHAARACDHSKIPAADAGVSRLDDGVLGVEFPVGLLERLRDPLDGLNHFQTFQKIDVHPAGVADQTENGDLRAFGNVNVQIHIFEPVHKVLDLGGRGAVFQYCDHCLTSPDNKITPHGNSCGVLR